MNNFDVELKWWWKNAASENNAFKQAVPGRLGLQFVPGNEPVELLVAEKVK